MDKPTDFGEQKYDKMGKLAERIRQNRSKLAVFNAIRQLGKATAPEIESRVEPSKPTVLRYLGELTEEELVIEQGQLETSTGRPPKLFSINASAAFSVGVDFGAPDLTLVLIDLAKNIIDKRKIPTELHESPSTTAQRIVEGVARKWGIPVVGVGLSALNGMIHLMGAEQAVLMSVNSPELLTH